jgi:hypothetical protein
MGKKSKIRIEEKCKLCRLAGVAKRERSVGRESPSPNGRQRLRSGALGGHERRQKPKAWGGGESRAVGGGVFLYLGAKGIMWGLFIFGKNIKKPLTYWRFII